MWQRPYKNAKVYHYLLRDDWRLEDDAIAQVACGVEISIRRAIQDVYPIHRRCGICNGVYHLVSTSVAEAMGSLKNQENVDVLRIAAEVVCLATLKKAIEAKIKRLDKAEVGDG